VSLRRVNRRWEELARTDPLWAILSEPSKRGNRWEANQFFRTGQEEIRNVLEHLESLGCRPERRSALDFGCGAGRLTLALASHFETAHGVDASPSMLDLARRYNKHGDRCTFHRVEQPPLPFPDGQHIPPRSARRYILELVRTIAPGGVATFQEAADPLPPADPARVGSRLKYRISRALPRPMADALRGVRLALRKTETFEMHGVPRERVEALVRKAGGTLVEVAEDRSSGDGWSSFRYWVTKAGTSG